MNLRLQYIHIINHREVYMKTDTGSGETRMLFVDNLRLYLIILVCLHHISIAYGGAGDWPVREAATDGISPIIFTLFNGINQSFFMSLFFFLSGFFLPRSLDKKGSIKFLTDRLIRLGIPILVFTTIINVSLDYIILNFVRANPVPVSEIIMNYLKHPQWDIGPLWFVEVLLIFALIYTIFRTVSDFSIHPFKNNFPPFKTIITLIIIMSLGSFTVRIFIPIGHLVHDFQLGHYFHYVTSFLLGITAFRCRWLHHLSESIARPWKYIGIFSIFALPSLMIIFGADKNIEPFLGGFSYKSLIFSVWESVACISISISLLSFFKNRFDVQGNVHKWMAPNYYTVYIIHMPVIVCVMTPFLHLQIPSYVKFMWVSIIAIPLCFLISYIIRLIPGTRRILG